MKLNTTHCDALIPVCNDGSFDLKQQQDIARKYKKIEDIKKSINGELVKITDSTIEL